MAQVYKFIDGNGEIRLLAEIDPPPASTFNGGTITGELIIDTAATPDQALELTGTRTSNAEIFGIDYPHQVVDVTSDGVALIASNDNMQATVRGDSDSGASLSVVNQPTGQFVKLHAKDGSAPLIEANNQNDGTPLLELTGSAVFRVQEDGTPRIFAHAAPADLNLNPGECALWFDQTNGVGNTKLMIKGCSANGTIGTAAIVLT